MVVRCDQERGRLGLPLGMRRAPSSPCRGAGVEEMMPPPLSKRGNDVVPGAAAAWVPRRRALIPFEGPFPSIRPSGPFPSLTCTAPRLETDFQANPGGFFGLCDGEPLPPSTILNVSTGPSLGRSQVGDKIDPAAICKIKKRHAGVFSSFCRGAKRKRRTILKGKGEGVVVESFP